MTPYGGYGAMLGTPVIGGGNATVNQPQPTADEIYHRAATGNMSASDNASGYSRWSLDNYIEYLDKRAQAGDEAAAEKLFNYYASEQSEKSARDWTAHREDTQYQRLMADLKAAGISPYILTGATPGVSNATGVSHSGSQMTSQYTNRQTQEQNERERGTKLLSSILSVIGTALMALAILG